jgi:ankyrin repeat protein
MVLRRALDNKADPDTILDDEGSTALMFAAEYADDVAVPLLLRHDADVHRRDATGKTALNRMMASEFMQTQATDFAEDRVARILNLFQKAGADFNTRDDDGRTPLYHAATVDDIDGYRIAEMLIEHGADVNGRTNQGWTPLMVAAGVPPSYPPLRQKGVLYLFLMDKGADPEASGDDGLTPLVAAVQYGNYAMVECLRERGVAFTTPAPFSYLEPVIAAVAGDTDRVQAALATTEGRDVDVRCLCERTALIWASERGDTDVMRVLLNHGADAEARDQLGWRPLLFAILRARLDACALLIDHGADMSAPIGSEIRGMPDSYNALAWAVECNTQDPPHYRSHRAIIRLLLERDAPIPDSLAVWTAARAGSAELVTSLWERGDAVAVHEAVMAGATEVLEALLNAGGDPNDVVRVEMRPAIHSALDRGNEEVVRILLRHGARIDYADRKGKKSKGIKTALMTAAECGQMGIVRLLLEAGADPKAVDRSGERAADYAEKNGHESIAALLRDLPA